MADSVQVVWNKFFEERSKTLWDRFPGFYRAEVVETNDPLNIGRIRFRCPDLHEVDLEASDCPWAVTCSSLGGKKAGSWYSPCIGDWVWITFERNHPYGPIWTGFCTPTRRDLQPPQQIHIKPTAALNDDGKFDDQKLPLAEEYLPADGRPMSSGRTDRYGNLSLDSAVGFFPIEHVRKPAPPGHDALQGAAFEAQQNTPEPNKPDQKMMLRLTKYGNMLLLNDQGYMWEAEFSGDAKADAKFEAKRWMAIQKYLSQGSATGDNRGCLLRDRYGSFVELRHSGWTTSRPGEFGAEPVELAAPGGPDKRWVRIQSKGGMSYLASDVGSDVANDVLIKRPMQEEARLDAADRTWQGRDARMIRLLTRSGIKFVLDDRGSSRTDAGRLESPRANGFLLKGRRTPSAKGVVKNGDPRGFYMEFNENDQANHLSVGSPLGQSIELNDRYQYAMLATSLGGGWAAKWRGDKENEFIRKPLMLADPEATTHHLKLDHENEYIRLKTRGGKGKAPTGSTSSGVGTAELNQGFEARDGSTGSGPWVELVDCQQRGIWFSKQEQLTVWRSKVGSRRLLWQDDRSRVVAIYNGQDEAKIQIYSADLVEIMAAGSLRLQAGANVTIKAGRQIQMQAGSTKLTVGTAVETDGEMRARKFREVPGGQSVSSIRAPAVPARIEPADRGRTYNGPFVECPVSEVEH